MKNLLIISLLFLGILSLHIPLAAQTKPSIRVDFILEKGTPLYLNFYNDAAKIEKKAKTTLLETLNQHIGYLNFKADSAEYTLKVILRKSDRSNTTRLAEYILEFDFAPDVSGHVHAVNFLSLIEVGSLGSWEDLVSKISIKMREYLKGQHELFAKQLFSGIVLSDKPLFLKEFEQWVLPFTATALLIDTDRTEFKIKLKGEDRFGLAEKTIESARYAGIYQPKRNANPKYMNCIRTGSSSRIDLASMQVVEQYVYISKYVWKGEEELSRTKDVINSLNRR